MTNVASLVRPRQLRFAVFYGALYFGFGAYLPYLPVWLEGRGLSPEMIGLAGAAGMIGRLASAPVAAIWSDRAPRRRDTIIAFTLATLVLFLAFIPQSSPWLMVALCGLAGAAMTGCIPVIDAFAMAQARSKHFAFGPPRAFGSVTFILGNLGAGALVSALGGEAALAWMIAGAALSAGAALLLPPGRRVPDAPGMPRRGPFDGAGQLLTGGFLLAFASSALLQGAHGFYYAFSAVAWTGQGIPAVAVGMLWSIGVAAEVVLLTFSAGLFRSWSPAQLMVAGGAASVLRWGLLSLTPPLALLFPLQLLHAFTFAATYLGFLRYAAEHAPNRFAATAQAINSALSGGIVLAAATMVSGVAYAAIGGAGFLVMVPPALAGLACALILMRRKPD